MSGVPASVKYAESSKLLSEYRLDPNDPIQTDHHSQHKTWAKVAQAVCLLCLGTLLLSLGLGFWFTGRPNSIPLIIIGSVAFLPGFYFSRIAWLSYRGYRGYSLSSIPDV